MKREQRRVNKYLKNQKYGDSVKHQFNFESIKAEQSTEYNYEQMRQLQTQIANG